MATTSYNLHGIQILAFAPEGKKLQSDRDAIELISEALQHKAGMVVIPEDRFEGDFFRLRTLIAGEIIQKFVNYRLRLAIIGDISRHVGEKLRVARFRTRVEPGQSSVVRGGPGGTRQAA